MDTGVNNDYAALFACDAGGKTELGIDWQDAGDRSKTLLADVPGFAAVDDACGSPNKWARQRWDSQMVADFRAGHERDWQVRTKVKDPDLYAENKKAGKDWRISLDTPFLSWGMLAAAILPGDQLVCNIGNQIAAIDLNTRRIGLIALGYSPVVIAESRPVPLAAAR
jgi:hypothetical protein